MGGDLRGDFSRLTFRPQKHYSAVLSQQGRVQLDADANEHTALLLHYMRTLVVDLVGAHAGPAGAAGFAITPDNTRRPPDLGIGPGRYYVDGILCELEDKDEQGQPQPVTYYAQPDIHFDVERDPLPSPPFVVYLKVWERHITTVEDPDIRETALGDNGPDTASRTKVVWQVLVTTKENPESDQDLKSDVTNAQVLDFWSKWEADRAAAGLWGHGQIKARAKQPAAFETEVCTISPMARYRGAENQLYRVEIHSPGSAGTATFKWSRDNAAVTFPIEALAPSANGAEVTLQSLGRDDELGLAVGQWVEIVDDEYAQRVDHQPLHRVATVHPFERRVTVGGAPTTPTGQNPAFHPLLRRWDQEDQPARSDGVTMGKDGTLAVVETTEGTDGWIELEDGVAIQFQKGGTYHSGDYWLIPARTATGDVEWPRKGDVPYASGPAGVIYHYAPLGLVHDWDQSKVEDLRTEFRRMSDLLNS